MVAVADKDARTQSSAVAAGFGIALLVVGVALVAGGLLALGDASIWAQGPVVGAGVLAVNQGVSRLIRVRRPGADSGLVLSAAWLVLVLLLAVAADWLPLGEYKDTAAALRNPTYQRPDLFSSHPLGTNQQGLDILARVIYGARVSLVVGLGAVAVGMFFGGMFGLIAGYYRRGVDTVIGIFTDALLAFPPLVLLVALASVLDRNLRNTVLGLAILAVPTNVRLARANTLRFTEREFVQAARALGANDRRIIFRELLPNIALPMMSYAFIIVAVLIVAEASISFLGLGIQQPQPTWGNMIAEGDGGAFEGHPHIVLIPGAVMFLTVFSFNRVGEWARSLLDPRELNV